jgi:hypothetical protein
MFTRLDNNQLNLSAHKVKNILGVLCDKKIHEIEIDIKYIFKSIPINILIGLPIKGLNNEFDNKYYSAILAEIFMNQLIFCLYNIQLIKLNIESYCKKNINNLNKNKYVETLPITNRDVLLISNYLEDNALIGINILYERFIDFLKKKLGFEMSINTYIQYDITLHLYNRFIISIESALSNKPSQTHGQLLNDFQELNNFSQNVWNMMSMLTYTEIFPFMMKSSDMLLKNLNSL